MVISFNVKEAREHLEKYGFVYTLRSRMRKRVGKDWYNHFRTDTKKGNVIIKYIDNYAYTERGLQWFVEDSGFETLEVWLKVAKDSRYLYAVKKL